ncbi:XapX domain-containing protein [Sphingobium vermicomposti]|uniref:XapX domain-containing protein n=1 Tax=Sphingobium vermicomposti TaxID=529005 RepID=A0A846MAB5_9SPHN|nr:XapX domain-containing protein [Sphingobium vermicomposti]NIJ17741.1 XapX domain-containing protein [Sphingobium vermicomposti]
MKPYILSLGAGLIVGIVYSLMGVRSPAPPVIALIGLAGILLGEQIIPVVQRVASLSELNRFVRQDCVNHVLGKLPTHGKRDA